MKCVICILTLLQQCNYLNYAYTITTTRNAPRLVVEHLRGQKFGLLEQHKYNIVIMVSKRHLVKENAHQKHTASGCSGLFGLRQLVSVFSLDVWCEHPQRGLKLFHGDPNILPKVTN